MAGAKLEAVSGTLAEIGGNYYAPVGAAVTFTVQPERDGYTVTGIKYGGSALTANADGNYTITPATGSELSVDVGVEVTGDYTVTGNGEVLVFTDGAQTVTVSEGVRRFTVENMSAGDKIVLPENLRDKNISEVDGGIQIDSLKILGVDLSSNAATEGIQRDGVNLNYVNSSTGSEILTVSGLQKSDGIRVSSNYTISIPRSSVVEGSDVELTSSGGTLSMFNDIPAKENYWKDNGGGSYSYITGITTRVTARRSSPTALAAAAPNRLKLPARRFSRPSNALQKMLHFPAAAAFKSGETLTLAKMDYTGIDGIKIGGEGSAPVDGSNFVAGVAAAEGVAGVAIAIPITNYCAKTVTVNNGSTLYNYVDGARIVVKPAATVYNYAANSAASVKITGSNGRDDIHNSGANSTIEEGDGSDEIRIGVPAADKTVVVADLTSGDTLFIEDFSLKYYSMDYDAAGNLVLETKQQKKLTIKGIGRLDETSTAETRWYENEGTLYYGNGSVSYTSRRRGNGLEITRTLNTGTENILQISGATGTPQIENDYLLKFTPENFLGDAEVLKNSKGYRYKFESGDYGGKTVTLPAPTAVFSSASNINLDMSKGAGYANREIYISGGDNVTVSGMNDGFIKIAQNVQKMTLTVTGMNADWSDIRFEGGITSYAQTMDGVLVNGNILIKGTNLQQENGWKIDSEHSATLSSGNSSGLVFIDKYHGHEANGYDRLKYKSGTDNAAKAIVRGISRAPSVKGGTITIEDDIFMDSNTAVTVSSASNYVYAGKKLRRKLRRRLT